MTVEEMITKIIKEWAPKLRVPDTLNGEAILWAIYNCEKYTPTNPKPRFEPSYAPGGVWYELAQAVRDEWAQYGEAAACSYSNFQIMYPTAVELGYIGPPQTLDRDALAIAFVVRYLNIRVFAQGAKTPEEVADAYNSGTFKDSVKPESYMKSFRFYYDRALRRIEQCLKDSTNKPADSTTEPTP